MSEDQKTPEIPETPQTPPTTVTEEKVVSKPGNKINMLLLIVIGVLIVIIIVLSSLLVLGRDKTKDGDDKDKVSETTEEVEPTKAESLPTVATGDDDQETESQTASGTDDSEYVLVGEGCGYDSDGTDLSCSLQDNAGNELQDLTPDVNEHDPRMHFVLGKELEGGITILTIVQPEDDQGQRIVVSEYYVESIEDFPNDVFLGELDMLVNGIHPCIEITRDQAGVISSVEGTDCDSAGTEIVTRIQGNLDKLKLYY